MWPILLKLGPLPINTFGVILVISFLVGKWYIVKDAIRQGLDGEQIEQLCWYTLAAIVLGGRLMFIITYPQPYLEAPWKVFYIWEGGLVYYGGFLATVGTVIWFSWKHYLPIWKLTDLFVVGGMLGLSVGRWGCFFAGDDHGRVIPKYCEDANGCIDRGTSYDFGQLIPGGLRGDDPHPIWAVKFEPTVGPWDAHPAMDQLWMSKWLYPAQWMMSAKALILFGLLVWIARRKRFDGQCFSVLLMGYAILRFVVELFRGDMDRGVYLQPAHVIQSYSLGNTVYPGFYLTTSQTISIVLFALGALLYFRMRNRGVAPVPKKPSSASAEKQVSSLEEPKAA